MKATQSQVDEHRSLLSTLHTDHRHRSLQQTHSVENTAPESLLTVLLRAMRTDHLDRSLPAHRRGTLRGKDAA
ncbi:hypothetical protein XaplCFBP3122_19115 [Xanthomonas arboricola pv. populi]|uniref:Uncharacterized protein n=1 Tax=Xanthomonas arboricola pv. populi TaxID=487823 RepID=A0A2S6YZT5_9XANT|nr:hypothetical protein XaplCFBP3122_19115 [Xanthomonas arboricola pv. populi]